MATAYFHAVSSAKKWGGVWEDYIEVHEWFDQTKGYHPDFRHRALRHHAEGIQLSEKVLGRLVVNSDGRSIPVRWIGERHVVEDLGFIPTASDWLRCVKAEPWMNRSRKLSQELQAEAELSQVSAGV